MKRNRETNDAFQKHLSRFLRTPYTSMAVARNLCAGGGGGGGKPEARR